MWPAGVSVFRSCTVASRIHLLQARDAGGGSLDITICVPIDRKVCSVWTAILRGRANIFRNNLLLFQKSHATLLLSFFSLLLGEVWRIDQVFLIRHCDFPSFIAQSG